MIESLSIGFTAKVVPVKPVNDEMTLCKCYIMALGKNNNKSNISKNAADDAEPTLFNIPVVGHVYVDDDGVMHMGAHDMKVVKNENGQYAFKMITVPYGTVPYQDNVHYEEVVEKNGTKNTYLVADIILWTARYPELLSTKYSDEVYFNQSMEIKPLSMKVMDDGYTDIQKYSYKALCLLGKDDNEEHNYNPCFPSARVEPYNFSEEEKWNELFEEFKNKLGESYSLHGLEKGGKETMDLEKISEILKEFNIEKPEDLSFEITEDMTEEQLREKLVEYTSEANFEEEGTSDSEAVATDEPEAQEESDFSQEPQAEETPEVESEEKSENFALSADAKREALANKIDFHKSYDRGFECCHLVDYDDKYAYARYVKANENERDSGYCRFSYTEEGSDVIVDKDSCEKVIVMWLTPDEASKLDKERSEYKELVEFKENQLKENKQREYAAVISEFEDLSDIDAYKDVVSNALAFENSEDLKEKLFAIRGKYGKYKTKTSLDDVRIPVGVKGNQAVEEDAETRFFSRYLPESIKK